jgi:septal ring factor EnvC (AmiA/AmiB activator)
MDALLLRLDDLEKEISRLEGQIAEARRQRAASGAVVPETHTEPTVPTPAP